ARLRDQQPVARQVAEDIFVSERTERKFLLLLAVGTDREDSGAGVGDEALSVRAPRQSPIAGPAVRGCQSPSKSQARQSRLLGDSLRRIHGRVDTPRGCPCTKDNRCKRKRDGKRRRG